MNAIRKSGRERKWKSRSKQDLIIEVWEALDCESIGEKEITEIERVVRDKFGEGAVDFPMKIARILADEGAELRHDEIFRLDFARRSHDPYDATLRNALEFSDFESSRRSLQALENVRRVFASRNDREGLRRLQSALIEAKEDIRSSAHTPRAFKAGEEICTWISMWLQSPEIFHNWIALRIASDDFRERFEIGKEDSQLEELKAKNLRNSDI